MFLVCFCVLFTVFIQKLQFQAILDLVNLKWNLRLNFLNMCIYVVMNIKVSVTVN